MSMQELTPGIVSDPNILNGKPVIAGTRIPVSFILANLEDMTISELAEDLGIEISQIKDAINYARIIISEGS